MGTWTNSHFLLWAGLWVAGAAISGALLGSRTGRHGRLWAGIIGGPALGVFAVIGMSHGWIHAVIVGVLAFLAKRFALVTSMPRQLGMTPDEMAQLEAEMRRSGAFRD